MMQTNRAGAVNALGLFASAVVLAFAVSSKAPSDTLKRLQPEQLKKTHAAVTKYQRKCRPVKLATGFRDYRVGWRAIGDGTALTRIGRRMAQTFIGDAAAWESGRPWNERVGDYFPIVGS